MRDWAGNSAEAGSKLEFTSEHAKRNVKHNLFNHTASNILRRELRGVHEVETHTCSIPVMTHRPCVLNGVTPAHPFRLPARLF